MKKFLLILVLGISVLGGSVILSKSSATTAYACPQDAC